MFLLASFLGFEWGFEKIKFIKQEYSEYAYHKDGENVSLETQKCLGLKEDESWYYRDQEMFFEYISRLKSSVLDKLIEAMNTIGDIDLKSDKKLIYEDGKENQDLKGKIMGIYREKIQKEKLETINKKDYPKT